MLADVLTLALVALGCWFFLSGTLGLLRFPDVYTRLHALTKADNLGLGLVAFGLLWQAPDWPTAVKLLLVWLLGVLASTTAAHMVGRAALGAGQSAWRAEP